MNCLRHIVLLTCVCFLFAQDPPAKVDANGVFNSMAIDKLIIPDNYRISSIYPNPFNPITSIEYSLPENADIELIVYNIYGDTCKPL